MLPRSVPFLFFVLLVLLLACGCSQTSPAAVPAPATPLAPGSSSGSSGASPSAPSPPATAPAVTTAVPAVRGTPDPAFVVERSVPEKIAPGTTILADNHDLAHPRIIEVNSLGEIVWEYQLPENLKGFTNPGWDVEVLPGGNILTVLPRYGVLEIARNKTIVWKYLDAKVSHDADRLPGGNTLVAFGAMDTRNDAQVREIDPSGRVVWSWYAKDVFTGSPYTSVWDEGWTHTNAVSRLGSGNTLVSLRNFNIVAEIDPTGKLVRKIGEGTYTAQHDPVLLPDGNILAANHVQPNEIIELDPAGSVVWRFPIRERSAMPARDANRLSNGNTLITGADRVLEVTPDRQIVWMFRLATLPFKSSQDAPAMGFYKAERISP